MALVATAYRVEPVDTPGQSLDVIGGDDCPQVDGAAYVLTLERQHIYSGVNDHTDRSRLSDIGGIACRPL